jgi:homoserine O-succinyltransferase
MLSVSKGAGVDVFASKQPSRFIFLQGHPEYEALTLQREYARDVRSYLAGEQEIQRYLASGVTVLDHRRTMVGLPRN